MPSPAEVKACLASLKQVLDNDPKYRANVEAMLQLELLLRGVIPKPDQDLSSAIIDTAGKALCGDVPVAAALAGRMVEKVAQSSRGEYAFDFRSALERCKQVDDDRLQLLLELLQDEEATVNDWYIVAEGYYLQAASLQPNVPPMWKQAWECVVARTGEPLWQASMALEQLRRIAQSKGNEKRATELGRTLMEAYLSRLQAVKRSSRQERLLHSFVQPYRPVIPPPLQKASDLLRALPRDELWAFRLAVVEQDELVDVEANQAYQRAQNRASGRSLEDHRREARLASEDMLAPLAKDLINRADEEVVRPWLTLYLQRQLERAAYDTLREFVETLLTLEWQDDALQDEIARLVPRLAWLSDLQVQVNDLRRCRDRLDRLFQAATSRRGVLQSNPDTETQDLECALRSTELAIALRTGEKVSSFIQSEPYRESSRSYGTSFLAAMVQWSGLHKPAWENCILPEAREAIAMARNDLTSRRSNAAMDKILLDIALADAEGPSFGSGFPKDSYHLYLTSLEHLFAVESSVSAETKQILTLHARIGLLALVVRNEVEVDGAEELVEACMHDVDEMAKVGSTLYLWDFPNSFGAAVQFQLTYGRRFVAESLIGKGRFVDAEQELILSVEKAPADAAASFALGSFLLRKCFFLVQDVSESALVDARVQLLKSAKLDSSQAGPFALLGYWYENSKDLKRALGCYSKALLLDPCHPVAGRGILRMTDVENRRRILDAATDHVSDLSGWAWYETGLDKAVQDGQDEIALVALLKALRCRDIDNPHSDSMSWFYVHPSVRTPPSLHGKIQTLTELGSCYRRLGRYSASLRSFHLAIASSLDDVEPSLLCSCGEVEMELGMFDEASDKFARALNGDVDSATADVARFGLGSAMLHLSRRDVQDGKLESAFARLKHGISVCRSSETTRGSLSKLLGDLHSAAAWIPSCLFESSGSPEEAWASKVAFVAKGESEFSLALAMDTPSGLGEREQRLMRASLLADIASNRLLQAQLAATWHQKGHIQTVPDEATALYQSAAKAFEESIAIDQSYAAAWCGLGCAQDDPLLAQHCFATAIELDPMSPDAYANLNFLYTRHKVPTTEIAEALSEVADSPFMWIHRASWHEEDAEDAYRAALQVAQEPEALAGLGLATVDGVERELCLSEYGIGACDIPTQMAASVSLWERGVSSGTELGSELMEEARSKLVECFASVEGSYVDVQAIEQTMDQICGDSEGMREYSLSRECLTNDILMNPIDAQQRLTLAQQLVAGLTDDSSDAVETACAAARHTARAFMSHVNPQAHAWADAVALSFCMEELHRHESEHRVCSKHHLTQAILLCPHHDLARRGLNALYSE